MTNVSANHTHSVRRTQAALNAPYRDAKVRPLTSVADELFTAFLLDLDAQRIADKAAKAEAASAALVNARAGKGVAWVMGEEYRLPVPPTLTHRTKANVTGRTVIVQINHKLTMWHIA